jgi:hypothetical protein
MSFHSELSNYSDEWGSNKGWNMAVFVPTSIEPDSESDMNSLCFPPPCDEEYKEDDGQNKKC